MIIDISVSVLSNGAAGWIFDPERLLRQMDACGITIAVLHCVGLDSVLGSMHTADQAKLYPDRFRASAAINPWDFSEKSAIYNVLKSRNYVGIDLSVEDFNPTMSNETWDELFHFIEECRLPIFLRRSKLDFESFTNEAMQLARRHRKCQFILTGIMDCPLPLLEHLLKHNQNLYIEIASGKRAPGRIEALTTVLPSEQMLFGSNCPASDPRIATKYIQNAVVSDTMKQKILSGNALQLFHLK